MEDDDDIMICTICEKAETDVNKVIECSYCNQFNHFKCKRIIGIAKRKVRSKPYFCSVTCQEMHQRSTRDLSQPTDQLNQLLVEMKALRQENASSRESMEIAIKEIQNSQSYLSDTFDDILHEIKDLKHDQSSMRSDLDDVERKCVSLNSDVERLECEVDRLNRAALSRNAIFLGVPVVKDELLPEIVHKICSSLGLNLPTDALEEVRRLKDSRIENTHTPIKAVFKEVSSKELLLEKKRHHGQFPVSSLGGAFSEKSGYITIRDEMTAYGMALLRDVRESQDVLKLKYVWPGRNGVVLVKRDQTSKIETIRNRTDVKNLVEGASKRRLEVSASSAMSSSLIEPSPKRRQRYNK